MIKDYFNLSGKMALVTGCSSGIGEAMAIGLAEAGADIVGLSGTISKDSPVAHEVQNTGQNFFPFAFDLGERAKVYEAISAIKSSHSKIDILINNAGIIRRNPVAFHPDEDWDKVLSVNLDAPFILAREFGKEMLQRKSGKIIFTCSLLSFQGGINVPGYAASKGAVASLVKAFANEWAASGINVNGIAPGYIATNNTDALRNDPERSKSILQRIPAGRWGEPNDFKGPVIFLCSAASNYIHGEILTVDGGWMGR